MLPLASRPSLYIITATGDKRMDELTARQAEVLQLIADFLQGTGFPPTRAEIAQQLGFRSANAAEEHLRALERKGYIEMLPGTSRGIRLRNTYNSACRWWGALPPAVRSWREQHVTGPLSDRARPCSSRAARLPAEGARHEHARRRHPRRRPARRSSHRRGASSGQIVVARLGTRSPSNASSAKAARCSCCPRTRTLPPSWWTPGATLW